MAKKPASLSAALMPVEEEAAIPPRTEGSGQKGREAESQQGSKAEKPNGDGPAVGLNFKVKPSFRKDFRVFCAKHDLSLVEGLAEAFELLKRAKEGKGAP